MNNVVNRIIAEFEKICNAYNKMAIFFKDKSIIASDDIAAIKDAILNTSASIDALDTASIQNEQLNAIRTEIIMSSEVNDDLADLALKVALADVLGI